MDFVDQKWSSFKSMWIMWSCFQVLHLILNLLTVNFVGYLISIGNDCNDDDGYNDDDKNNDYGGDNSMCDYADDDEGGHNN